MTSAPLVSVCTPTYNGDRYLAECLETVLSQTLEDFEVIVGDVVLERFSGRMTAAQVEVVRAKQAEVRARDEITD